MNKTVTGTNATTIAAVTADVGVRRAAVDHVPCDLAEWAAWELRSTSANSVMTSTGRWATENRGTAVALANNASSTGAIRGLTFSNANATAVNRASRSSTPPGCPRAPAVSGGPRADDERRQAIGREVRHENRNGALAMDHE